MHSCSPVAGLSPSFQGHFLFAGQKDFIFHGNLTVEFRFIDFRHCVGFQAIHCKSSWTDAVTLELPLLFAAQAEHIFFIILLLLQRFTCGNQELTNGCKWSFRSGQKLFSISSSVHLEQILWLQLWWLLEMWSSGKSPARVLQPGRSSVCYVDWEDLYCRNERDVQSVNCIHFS